MVSVKVGSVRPNVAFKKPKGPPFGDELFWCREKSQVTAQRTKKNDKHETDGVSQRHMMTDDHVIAD